MTIKNSRGESLDVTEFDGNRIVEIEMTDAHGDNRVAMDFDAAEGPKLCQMILSACGFDAGHPLMEGLADERVKIAKFQEEEVTIREWFRMNGRAITEVRPAHRAEYKRNIEFFARLPRPDGEGC